MSAAPIVVYNTGVDNSSTVLPDGSVDPHYTLVTSADSGFPGPNAIVVNSTGFPIPPWVANDSQSKWLAPQANQSAGNAPGTYIYSTTFSLAGLNPATAVLTGQWTSDNGGSIQVNGTTVTTGQSGATGSASYGSFTSFTLNSANASFNAGTNTLRFIVVNDGPGVNPTGLNVRISGTADVANGATVPEPATFALVGFVLMAGSLLSRRRI